MNHLIFLLVKLNDQDWQLVSKDKDKSGESEKEGVKQPKEVDNKEEKKNTDTNTQTTKKDLEIHAKNTSEQALNAAVQNSADEEVRKIAHQELNRRSKEEAIQEEKDKGEKKPEKKELKKKPVEKKEESKFTEKFRELSDSQVEFYLNAPDEEVKKSAKEVLAERGLRTVTQEEYEKDFNTSEAL